MPVDESNFLSAISSAKDAYDAAANDMAKGGTRANRRNAICNALNNSPAVNGWVGTIKSLSSNTEGKGVLVITLDSVTTVETTNNEFSETLGGTHTLLDQNSDVFRSASRMKEGDAVVFSGNFYPSDTDCTQEMSLTLEGSMEQPTFLFQFASIGSPSSLPTAASAATTTSAPQSPAPQQQDSAVDTPSQTNSSASAEPSQPATPSTSEGEPTGADNKSQSPVGNTGPRLDVAQRSSETTEITPALRTAVTAYDQRDFASAFALLAPLAERGNAFAQCYIAEMYLHGKGIERDPATASAWFKLSANAGVSDAQNYLGALYRRGEGVKLDYGQAMQWYLMAARQDYENSEYQIGLMYYHGQGFPKDWLHAYMWTTIAAQSGQPEPNALKAKLEKYLSVADVMRGKNGADAWRRAAITPNPISTYSVTQHKF